MADMRLRAEVEDGVGAAGAEFGVVGVGAEVVVVFPAADAFFHVVVRGAGDDDGFFAVGGGDDDFGDDEEFFEDGGLNWSFDKLRMTGRYFNASFEAFADDFVAACDFELFVQFETFFKKLGPNKISSTAFTKLVVNRRVFLESFSYSLDVLIGIPWDVRQFFDVY